MEPSSWAASLDNLNFRLSERLPSCYQYVLFPLIWLQIILATPVRLTLSFFLSGCFGRCFRLPPYCWRPAHHISLPLPYPIAWFSGFSPSWVSQFFALLDYKFTLICTYFKDQICYKNTRKI